MLAASAFIIPAFKDFQWVVGIKKQNKKNAMRLSKDLNDEIRRRKKSNDERKKLKKRSWQAKTYKNAQKGCQFARCQVRSLQSPEPKETHTDAHTHRHTHWHNTCTVFGPSEKTKRDTNTKNRLRLRLWRLFWRPAACGKGIELNFQSDVQNLCLCLF